MCDPSAAPVHDLSRLGFTPDMSPEAAARVERLLEVMPVLRPFADALGLALSVESFAPHAHRLGEHFAVPGWVDGRINLVEAAVLDLFVRALKPETVVEVGVASGVSSAALLSSLSVLGPSADPRLGPRLRSYDTITHCYFDETREVGAAVKEMVPRLSHDQLIKRGGAKTASDDLGPEAAKLAFIDANHDHPAPTADLIDLAPCLVPGAWVVLHDIRLSKIFLEQEPGSERRSYGPEVLFDAWPGEKVKGETFASNIGAIRVDQPGQVTPEWLRSVIDVPWEVGADSVHVRRTLGVG